MWDKELAAEEVTAIRNGGVPKDESATSNLVGYWRMGEDVVYTPIPPSWMIPDDSTNSNAGTYTNPDADSRVNNAPGNDT